MKLDNFLCKENIDLDEYYNYFLEIKSGMDNPLWLGDLKKEDFKYLLSNGSKIWCFFDSDNFVCSFMYIKATVESIKSLGLNLSVDDCVECGPMFVRKEYRGNSLQYQMFKKLEDFSKENNFKYILTTANPDNYYSSDNMEKAGYKKVGYKVFSRGPRNIYVKEI